MRLRYVAERGFAVQTNCRKDKLFFRIRLNYFTLKWCTHYILSKKSSAQMGFRVNSVLARDS